MDVTPLPYKKFTKLMMIYLIQDMITCLNMFLYKNGISSILILTAIILGSPNPYYNKLKTKFGAYAQVYICTINSTKQRTVGAMALKPAYKWGGYYFMSLATGK